jgi:hypothetical protein
MNSSQAPRSDGFSAGFFHKAWLIVGVDLAKAIQDFFKLGKLLKEVDATIITLVPKNRTLQ